MALRVLREKTSHLENLQTHFHTSPTSDQNSLNHPSFAEWLFLRGLNGKKRRRKDDLI